MFDIMVKDLLYCNPSMTNSYGDGSGTYGHCLGESSGFDSGRFYGIGGGDSRYGSWDGDGEGTWDYKPWEY